MTNFNDCAVLNTVKKMTEKLMGIDSVAGCTFDQQIKICSNFVNDTLESLGVIEGEIFRDKIIDCVIDTIVHYNDYLYEGL